MSNLTRNGGNNWRARGAQRTKSLAQRGVTMWASFGHHSYPKGHGGGNKVGAITHAPKEWGSKARKEEEHLTGLAKQAEVDAITEGVTEVFEDAWNVWRDPADRLNDELYDEVFDIDLPGVSLNGHELRAEDRDDYDWFDPDRSVYYDNEEVDFGPPEEWYR